MSDARKAEVEIVASSRGLTASLRKIRSKFSSFLGEQRSSFNKFAGRTASSALGNFGGDLAGRGLDFLTSGFRAQAAFNDQLTRFGIAADRTPEQLAALAKGARDVSLEVGIGKDKLLAGTQQYVALTGQADEAAAAVRVFGRVAQASGSQVDDIAGTAASLRDNLKVDPKDFEAAFSALIVQGKAGSIELKDLAAELSSVAPSFAAFDKGAGLEGMRNMGAALQVVRKGFGSSAEAATGMRALMVSINRHSAKFEKAGIKVFNKDAATGVKTLKSFDEIVNGIADSELAKDPTLLTDAFGSDEAKRAYDQLAQNRSLWIDLIDKSRDATVVQRDLARYTQSDAGKVTLAWEKAKVALADAFTPERIQAFSAAMIKAAEGVAAIVDGLDRAATYLGKVPGAWRALLGGSSEEERVYKIQQARERERKAMIAGRLGISPLDHSIAAKQRVNAEFKKEEGFSSELRAGLETIKGGQDNRFELQRREMGLGTMEYYNRLTSGVDKSGASDAAYMKSLVAQLQAAAMIKQIFNPSKPLLVKFADDGTPVIVKVGDEAVVKATRKSTSHRRRPGG